MHQIGNHQADGERTAGHQGAGRQVRLVVQLLHSLEHALPGFLADVLVVPEDFRDGHDGHAEVPRDVLHPDGHVAHYDSIPWRETERLFQISARRW